MGHVLGTPHMFLHQVNYHCILAGNTPVDPPPLRLTLSPTSLDRLKSDLRMRHEIEAAMFSRGEGEGKRGGSHDAQY